MSSNNNPNLIQIHVNENMKKVYDNQSVLQALLQIDENIQHCCHAARNYQIDSRNFDCKVRHENHDRKRNFKACLAPVTEGMKLKTK